MNLIIDIGNTRAKVFAFDGTHMDDCMTTGHELAGLADFVRRTGCQRGIYATTAHLTDEGRRALGELPFGMMQLTGRTPVPVRIMYQTPATLGADRIAGIVGARSLQPEGDLLVFDAGTCLTIDILDSENHYLGGNISPGLEMRLKAMHKGTAALPLISPEGDTPRLGCDTTTALRSGAVWGMRHEIEGYIRAFRQKYPRLSVFLTGGDAQKLDMSTEFINFADDFLVPRGLNQILNYNQ